MVLPCVIFFLRCLPVQPEDSADAPAVRTGGLASGGMQPLMTYVGPRVLLGPLLFDSRFMIDVVSGLIVWLSC
jgi:hypothetical protein